MPPRSRISKEDLLACAYEIAVRDGIDALSSRNVAKAAGCSVQPIFSHFPTMEDLYRETYLYACHQCAEELLSRSGNQDFFTELITWMVDLTIDRPNLFKLLYLSHIPETTSIAELLVHSELSRDMVKKISQDYGLSLHSSEDVLVRSCLFLLGIGTVISINQMDIDKEEVRLLMHRTVHDLLMGARKKLTD